MPSASQEITTAYRRLYRAGLRAVQYSVPSRYTLRDRLRYTFRASRTEEFEQIRIDNTIEFLNLAAQYRGLEHKIVKNLMHVWFIEPKQWQKRSKVYGKPDGVFHAQAYDAFYHTLRMLNESMVMCIR